MNDARLHIIYTLIIAALLAVLGISLCRPERVETVVKHTTDTLEVVVKDTVEITKVVTEVKKEPADTVWITVNDTTYVPVPMREYQFSSDGMFEFRVKGYNVNFIGCTIYPEVVYRTITNTIEKEILVKKWDFYLGAGFYALNEDVIPKVSFAVKAPNRWLFEANAGYYRKSLACGATVFYNLGK